MKFSRTLLLLNCLFIILTYSCLDVIQQPGKCSDCLSTEVLQTGYCYAKIRGCQIQQNDAVLGSKCSTCQSGYILSANSCIRTAVLDASNLTISSQIPPVQINTNTLGKDQIINASNVNGNSISNAGSSNVKSNTSTNVQNSSNSGGLTNSTQSTPSIDSGFRIVGGYSPMNSTDPNFQIILNFIIQSYPELSSWRSSARGEYQIVAGINYRFALTNALMDIYVVVVYAPLGNQNYLITAFTKNGVDFSAGTGVSFKRFAELGNDTAFQQSYRYFLKQTQNTNITASTMVRISTNTAILHPNICYTIDLSTAAQSAQVIVINHKEYQASEINKYLINQVESYKSSMTLALSDDLINQYLLQINPFIFGLPFILEKYLYQEGIMKGATVVSSNKTSISILYNVYLIRIICRTGIFNLVLDDKFITSFELLNLAKMTDETCTNLDILNPISALNEVYSFVANNYSLIGYQPVLAQVNIDTNNYVRVIRVLFSTQSYRQVEIVVNYNKGNISTISAKFLSGGFYILDLNVLKTSTDPIQQALYQSFNKVNDITISSYATYLSNSKILVVRYDGLQLLIYYTSVSATYCIVYQPLGQINSANNTNTNKLTLSLVTTKEPTSNSSNNSCLSSAFDSIFNANVCSICAKGLMPDGQFCYTQIDGCKVQTAGICIICEKTYVLKNGACLMDCIDIFGL